MTQHEMAQKSSSDIQISIVVPVYRSEPILPKLVDAVLKSMTDEKLADHFELILVNDCSPDNSWEVISKLANEHEYVKGINLRRNFGQHNATMAGLNHVSGDIVVIMDDDLQHPPEVIGKMITAISDGYDVCYTRYKNRKHPLWKKLGSQFNDWASTKFLGKPRGLYLSSFKAIRREVVEEVIKYDGPYAYVDGLILDVTRSITAIDIEHQARLEGEGNYSLLSSISLWMKMATSFSVSPLRFASFMGFALALLSLVMIAIIFIQKILHPEMPAGWASLIATILFIGGVQTLCIGMIGEYLGRTYLKLNGKPQYTVAGLTWKNDAR
ncbi:dolichol-phosphate mannosyltransferase [Mariprofundus micogutta]|uniref:Dolichol-phosphate mannosyltransferase n=1 Tax=Mariprofundus micogutta TaxID=1921010 RepID=A0A1L8CN30_9PROT|nr:glycosyltransferase family 2 protein [Mariprofundus micogutta]GAV20303.1 dolichol-phosphate mannosyltransferase [Mariprofundus micogutta]